MFYQPHWLGHASHMNESRIPKAMLYSKLCQDRNDRDSSKQFKDQLKCQLTLTSINYQSQEQLADNKDSQH